MLVSPPDRSGLGAGMPLKRSTIWILLAVWAVAMVLSGLALLEPPEGDGFTRGLNRIMSFLSWQIAGALIALGLWFGVRPLDPGDVLRRLGRLTGWWAMALFGLVAIWVLVAVIGSL